MPMPEFWQAIPITDARCCPHCVEHVALMRRLIELAEIANRIHQKRPVGRPKFRYYLISCSYEPEP